MHECGMGRVGHPLLPAPLLAVLALAAGPAAAHPHVFVTNKVAVLFDDFFSSTLLEDFDADGDGGFDAAEVAALHDNAFVPLRDYGWFTHLYLDGEERPAPEPSGFRAVAEGELVRYRFDLMLPAPVDPAATLFEVAIYDQEYYVEVLLDADSPVTLEASPPACRATVAEDETRAYYFGMVYPQMIGVECGPA